MFTAVDGCTACLALLLFVDVCLESSDATSDKRSGRLECEHEFPRLPYSTVARKFRNSCFQFVAEEKYWPDARRYCLRYGGDLATINDLETNEFIVSELNGLWWQNNGVWIGLNDRSHEQHWQWARGEPMLWVNWAEGDPGSVLHQLRDCVRMARSRGLWLWRETPCESFAWKYHFICQYSALPTTTDSQIRRETEKLILPAIVSDGVYDIEDYRPEVESVDASNRQPPYQASLATTVMITAVVMSSALASAAVAIVVVVAWKRFDRRKGSLQAAVVHSCSSTTDTQCSVDNCEADVVCETSRIQCRHVTANYYVKNPPWSTPPTHRLLPPCPPPSSPPPSATSSTPAVYCPMNGTVRRLQNCAASSRLSPDDPAAAGAASYVPMDAYNRLVGAAAAAAAGNIDNSPPQTGNDVVDECGATVSENIYEPLSDMVESENDADDE